MYSNPGIELTCTICFDNLANSYDVNDVPLTDVLPEIRVTH